MADSSALSKRLKALGYQGERADFNDVLADCLAAVAPGCRVDGLRSDPQRAMVFCRAVRERSGLRALSNEEILTALINLRKRGSKMNPDKKIKA